MRSHTNGSVGNAAFCLSQTTFLRILFINPLLQKPMLQVLREEAETLPLPVLRLGQGGNIGLAGQDQELIENRYAIFDGCDLQALQETISAIHVDPKLDFVHFRWRIAAAKKASEIER